MIHSPLKTALAYECFQDQASSTLALPSDHKLKTKGTGKQRVQEQVMMTVKRQKQKSSVSSSVGHSNRGNAPPCAGQQGVPFGTGAGAVSFCGVRAVCIYNRVPRTGDAGVSCVGTAPVQRVHPRGSGTCLCRAASRLLPGLKAA